MVVSWWIMAFCAVRTEVIVHINSRRAQMQHKTMKLPAVQKTISKGNCGGNRLNSLNYDRLDFLHGYNEQMIMSAVKGNRTVLLFGYAAGHVQIMFNRINDSKELSSNNVWRHVLLTVQVGRNTIWLPWTQVMEMYCP